MIAGSTRGNGKWKSIAMKIDDLSPPLQAAARAGVPAAGAIHCPGVIQAGGANVVDDLAFAGDTDTRLNVIDT